MTIGIFFIFPAVFYMVLVWRWTAAITSPKLFGEITEASSVTVVVPFRNEGVNTINLLRQLEKQKRPEHIALECLFVDDHSTDGGAEQLQHAIDKSPCNARLVKANGKGKKAAQTTGVEQATSHVVLTLDADVHLHPLWLSTLAGIHIANGWAYTSATVIPLPANTFVGKLASLEFLSLQAATEGSFVCGQPFMSNGANSAFDTRAWREARTVRNDEKIASGDDVFLVQALLILRKPMGHAAHPNAVVYTQMPGKWRDVLVQRTRWAAKTTHYTSRHAQMVAVYVALVAVFQLTGWFFSPYLWAMVWIGKTAFDLRILKTMGNKYSVSTPLGYGLALALVYPMYTLLVVALTLLNPLIQQPNKQWK